MPKSNLFMLENIFLLFCYNICLISCIIVLGLAPSSPGQQLPVDTIRRHEVDTVLANQNSIIAQARELRY